jgi:hypothetical protein
MHRLAGRERHGGKRPADCMEAASHILTNPIYVGAIAALNSKLEQRQLAAAFRVCAAERADRSLKKSASDASETCRTRNACPVRFKKRGQQNFLSTRPKQARLIIVKVKPMPST